MEENSLKRKAFSSIFWKLLERIAAQLVSLIVSIIIARLLDPSDYGVVSVVTIFFTFANVIISGGLNTALIQKKNADKKDYSTVLIITIIFSLLVYALLFIFSPMISRVYKQPLLKPIMRVMGVTVLINGVKSVVCAYVSATLQFKKFFYSTLGGTIASGIIGIYMAMTGFGAWALVVQQMSNAFVDTVILTIVTKFKVKLQFSKEKAKSLFGYGWKILVASLVNTIYNQIRPLVIGVRYTSADLSFYSKGESFPQLITSTTTDTLSAVLFPVLSKVQDNKSMLLDYTRTFIKVSSFLVFPLMIGMACVSDNLVYVLLSEKWMDASLYIKIFSISGMFSMINSGNCQSISAMGKSGIFLKMEVIKKSAYFIIIIGFLAFSNSPEALAYSSLLCTLVAIIVNTIPNRHLLDYKYKDQLTDVMPNLITAIIMGLVVIAIGKIIDNNLICLIVQVLSGGVIYLGINYFTKNESLEYLLKSLNMLKAGRAV